MGLFSYIKKGTEKRTYYFVVHEIYLILFFLTINRINMSAKELVQQA